MKPCLKFNIRNQNISRVDTFLPVRYSRNYLYAEFEFLTDDWSNVAVKTALFKSEGNEPIPVILGDTCTCIVPWEVLESTKFTVTVFGGDLVTVDSADIKLYESGYRSGDIKEPTPDVYTELIGMLKNQVDGMKYENSILSLLSGDTTIASVTIKGGSGGGADAKEIELQNNGAYIQWRYVGDDDWKNLIALSDLHGKSAYEYAKEGGYTGTEGEFAQKLAAEYLTEETDPTVSAWAKKPTKPNYTADEVGADTAGTAENKVSTHNTATDAHSDIRLLVQGLTNRLNALADSDDTTLDQMSEVVAYIKSNKSLIDAITTSKINVSDIIDNLTTNVSNKPLSAAQGIALKALIDAIVVPTKTSDLQNDSNFIQSPDTAEVGQVLEVEAVDENGKPTSWKTVTLEDGIANIRMTAEDTDVTIEPVPKCYIFPEMGSLTISPTEGEEDSYYSFKFNSGATATSLTINGVTLASSSDTVGTNATYEVNIWDGVAIIKAVS